MKTKGLFSVACCSIVALSCGKKDSSTTTGAFLSLSDFPTTGLTDLSAEQALLQLENDSAVYDNEPTQPTTTPTGDAGDSEDSSISKCIETNAPKLNVINKDTLNLDANIDLSSCLKEQFPAGSASSGIDTSTIQAKMRFVYNITCPGADISEFNGKAISELGSDDGDSGVPSALEPKCKELNSIKKFGNASVEFKLGTAESSMKMAMFKKDGQACEWTKVSDGFKLDGCINAMHEVTKTPVALGSSATIEAKKTSIFEMVNLVDSSSATAVWFGGGQLKFTLNNITGTLSYSSTSTAPTYTIAGGGTGTLGSSAVAQEFAHPRTMSNTLPHAYLRAMVRRLPFQSLVHH